MKHIITEPNPIFDAYAEAEPSEPWNYNLDDDGFTYGDGTWPLYRHHNPIYRPPHTPRPAGIFPSIARIAPDTEYKAWRTQYVLISPCSDDGIGWFQVELFLREQGMGGYIQRCDVSFSEATLQVIQISCPEINLAAAQAKAVKVMDFLRKCCADRDAGIPAPTSAHQIWNASKKQPH